MAPLAGINGLFRRELKERNDGGLAAVRVDMRTPGAVATLAARIFRFLFAAGNALEMRILVKSEPNIGMTGLTHHAADVRVLRLLMCVCGQTGKNYERQRSSEPQLPVNTMACVSEFRHACSKIHLQI